MVTATMYWGWTAEKQAVQASELPRLLAELTGPDGLLTAPNQHDIPSAWRADGADAPLKIGIVFDDLLGEIAALRDRVQAHGAELWLQLAEAPSEHDPLHHLRPSQPAVPRFDVVVTETGVNRTALTAAVIGATGKAANVVDRLVRLPVPIVVARALPEHRARQVADAVTRGGATTELRRNDA